MAAQRKMPAFEIDDRIVVKIEPELAAALGQLILDTVTTNTALLALGHQLRSYSNDQERHVLSSEFFEQSS